ncbi:unnamed protein product [Schistosoma turkestanicum]|nr:unnamed protein product [Schistosoma turkestanicum]
MQNIFQPHPFSTTVGTLTERATDSGQPSEDWALILEICDTVNETDDGPREAIRAIKKRLVTSAGKDNVSIWYTLTLLETLVKNCGKRFHSQVANKEFLHAFLKLLSPKNDPPQQLQTKVLYMLKCWISSNWDVAGKRDLEKIYASLLQKGVQFPTVSPADCHVAKPSRGTSLRDNLVISKTGVIIPRTGSQGNDKLTGRSILVKNPGLESDIRLRNHSAVHSSQSSNIPHSYSSTSHCTHESNMIQSLACCHNIHSNDDSTMMISCNRPIRNVHFDQTSSISNDCTVMVVNSDNQPSSVICQPHHCLPSCSCSSSSTNHPFQSTNQHHHHQIKDDQMEFDENGIVRHLNSVQRIKLTEDLTIIETNINVLNDLLAELKPDTITEDDLNLLKELNCTCRIMHQRIMEFLSQVADEEVTTCLIQMNDNLTNALSRYDRFERYYQRALENSNHDNEQIHSRPTQLCLTASSHNPPNLRHHRTTTNPSSHCHHHHHHHQQERPQPQQQQQLAITAGPLSSHHTTRNESSALNDVTLSRLDGSHNHHRLELMNGNQNTNPYLATAITDSHHHHANADEDDDDDDDESLLDISEGPSDGGVRSLTTRSHDSDDTDEIAQWLASRQLIPVSSPPAPPLALAPAAPTPSQHQQQQQQHRHSHRHFQQQHQQPQSATINNRSHSCVQTNQLTAITNSPNTTTTTTGATTGVSLSTTQSLSSKSIHSHQSLHHELL